MDDGHHKDHRAFLAALTPQAKARLTARSDGAGLRHLALYLAALSSTSAGIILQPPLWPLLMLPQGILLVFLFTLSHECTHKTPFRTNWLNEVTGHIIAPLIALPFTWFRYFHLAHHRHTNDPQHDPELADGGRPSTIAAWLWYLAGLTYWAGNIRVLVAHAAGRFGPATYLPDRRKPAMQREARIVLTLYALAGASLLWSPLALWLWVVPLILGQPFLRAYLLAEHGLCPPVADMFENTRTTFTMRLVRFLAWNMPFHAEHHTYPSVPFHRLPDLHRLVRDDLRSTSNGYGEFSRDYLNSLDRKDAHPRVG